MIPKIIPINELKNTSNISKICKESTEPIIITKNGYSDMVIMSVEVYERTIALLDNKKEKKIDPLKEIDQFIKGL